MSADAHGENSLEGSPQRPSDIRTFMIADVRGYTHFTLKHGEEAAARLAQRFGQVSEEIVRSRDGQVIELRGDEALAVFPSARQALRASLELQDRFASESSNDPSLPLKVGIGLDAGEAIPVGEGYRGAALNLAARLCSLAGPGEVLASEGVSHLARKLDGLAYIERGAVPLKGFTDPVRVVQVMVESDGPGQDEAAETQKDAPPPIGGFLGALPSASLIGRHDEMRNALSAIESTEGGSGRTLLLSGEPGVGKTRLAQEVTLVVRNHGFLFAAGRSYEAEQTSPYYPFLEVLPALYGQAPEALRNDAARRWPDLRHLLGEHMPGVSAAPPQPDDQNRLFRAATSFIVAVAEQRPIAILLDDLHWVDASSLKLLQHLARHTRSHSVLLVGTYRDVEINRQHPLEAVLRDMDREQLIERIQLRRLLVDETSDLIASTMGEAEVSEGFADLVQARTEGNPFFVQQVLRVLVERGDVYREKGKWERRDLGDIEVPESVRSVIGQRLSRLSEPAQETLREASVLGQVFSFDDLLGVSGRDEQEVESVLVEAAAAGLVRETAREVFGFDHALTQQALYAELSGRRKRRLHLAAAETLEHQSQGVRDQRLAELALHFLEGDDSNRAMKYSLQAGDRAWDLVAYSEAEWHYRTAAELAREGEDRVTLAQALEKLAEAVSRLGRVEEGLEIVGRADTLYAELGDLEGRVRSLDNFGNYSSIARVPDKGIDRLLEVLSGGGLQEELSTAARATIRLRLSSIFGSCGRHREQLEEAQKASLLAGQGTDAATLVRARIVLGNALVAAGRLEEGQQLLEETLPSARLLDSPPTLRSLLVNIGDGFLSQGQFSACVSRWEEALALSEQYHVRGGISFDLGNLAQVLFFRGEWQRSRDYAERAMEVAQLVDENWTTAYPLFHRGGVSIFEGDWADGQRDLQTAIANARVGGDLQAERWAQRYFAVSDILQGQAQAAVDRLLPLVDRGDWEEHTVRMLLPTLAWAQLESGDVGQANKIALAAEGRAREQGNEITRVEALLVLGMTSARQQRWEEAEQRFREARGAASPMPYPLVEAQALYELGRMQVAQGKSGAARSSVLEAREIFERLGATPYLERIHDVLQTITE